jgi:hypothetical protein
MTYSEQLESTKEYYPFSKWKALFFPDPEDEGSEGQEQYTEENCDAAKMIFDNLIQGLITIGEHAPENEKVALFKIAVESLNDLEEKVEGLIETGEREDLCDLIDQVTIAAGLNPGDYADGEGIADEWRSW